MKLLAFVVLAGLALVVLLTYSKRHRNRDRWPYNLGNPSDTPNSAGSDQTLSPATTSLLVAGAVVLNDELAGRQAQQASDNTDNTPLASTEYGATGPWGESGDTGGGFDSGGGDGGWGDGGGGDGGD